MPYSLFLISYKRERSRLQMMRTGLCICTVDINVWLTDPFIWVTQGSLLKTASWAQPDTNNNTFIEHLLHAGHYSKYLTLINSFYHHKPWGNDVIIPTSLLRKLRHREVNCSSRKGLLAVEGTPALVLGSKPKPSECGGSGIQVFPRCPGDSNAH